MELIKEPAKRFKPEPPIESAAKGITREINSRDHLNDMARQLLTYIGSLDPTWEMRIEITKSERNFDDLQTLGSFVVNVLEQGSHLIVSDHAFFTKDFGTAYDPRPCPECGTVYTPQYAGQPVDTNECGVKWHKRAK